MRTILTTALVAALLGVAGCGGDDSDDSTEPAPAEVEAPATADAEKAKDERDAKPAGDGKGGDSRDADEPAAEPPAEGISLQEFAARADRICRSANEKLQREIVEAAQEAADGGQPSSSAYSSGYVDLFRTSADEIAALPAPTGGPSPGAFVEALREYADVLEDVAAEFGKISSENFDEADQARLQALTEDIEEITKRLRSLARDYGFKVCGRSV